MKGIGLKAVICAGLCVALAGCATISVEADGVKASYTRIGDQNIKGLSVRKTEGGFVVALEGQRSDAEVLSEAIKVIGTLAGEPGK